MKISYHLPHRPNTSHQDRICLPYGLGLLDLARWVDVALCRGAEREFELIAGEHIKAWRGRDAIDLYSVIQRHCLSNSLSDSHIYDVDTDSYMTLDQHERFAIFSASPKILAELYPFTREVLWENFLLLQEEDVEMPPSEIFLSIYSVQKDTAK